MGHYATTCGGQPLHPIYQLRERAETDGLTFVDLTPVLQAAARDPERRDLLYFLINVHYAPAGQRVVADTLAAVIRAHPHGTRVADSQHPE